MNTRTKVWIVTICTQLLTISVCILVLMADSWMSEGFGLNPWIALPIATLFMGLPYIMADLFPMDDGDADSIKEMRDRARLLNEDTARKIERTKRLNEETIALNKDTKALLAKTDLRHRRHMVKPGDKAYNPERSKFNPNYNPHRSFRP